MLRPILAILMLVAALALSSGDARADGYLYVRDGIYLNARIGPGTRYRSYQVLAPRTRLQIITRIGDWAQVRTPDGVMLWVYYSYLIDTPSYLPRRPPPPIFLRPPPRYGAPPPPRYVAPPPPPRWGYPPYNARPHPPARPRPYVQPPPRVTPPPRQPPKVQTRPRQQPRVQTQPRQQPRVHTQPRQQPRVQTPPRQHPRVQTQPRQHPKGQPPQMGNQDQNEIRGVTPNGSIIYKGR